MASFHGLGSTAPRLEPLRGGSLPFTTKFPETPGAHFINLGSLKAESTLEPPSGFEHGTPGLRIQGLIVMKFKVRYRIILFLGIRLLLMVKATCMQGIDNKNKL